jgi:hypothetical protein
MYFDKESLNESVLFTIKNFLDYIFSLDNKVIRFKRKWEKAAKEFNQYYTISDRGLREIRYAIDQLSKTNDVIDIKKLKKFVRYDKLYVYPGLPDSEDLTEEEAYAIFYRIGIGNELPDNITSYIYPYILDDSYVLYFIFDENEIKYIFTIASKNMYDIKLPVYFTRIDINNFVDKDLFNK